MMTWGQYQYFLLLSATLLLLTGVSAVGEANGLGGKGEWTQIENLRNPQVHELGEFAVSEYNKQARASLKLHNIMYGEIQRLVSGTNYRFVMAVVDGGNLRFSNKYVARVWENVVVGARTLDAFTPINE